MADAYILDSDNESNESKIDNKKKPISKKDSGIVEENKDINPNDKKNIKKNILNEDAKREVTEIRSVKSPKGSMKDEDTKSVKSIRQLTKDEKIKGSAKFDEERKKDNDILKNKEELNKINPEEKINKKLIETQSVNFNKNEEDKISDTKSVKFNKGKTKLDYNEPDTNIKANPNKEEKVDNLPRANSIPKEENDELKMSDKNSVNHDNKMKEKNLDKEEMKLSHKNNKEDINTEYNYKLPQEFEGSKVSRTKSNYGDFNEILMSKIKAKLKIENNVVDVQLNPKSNEKIEKIHPAKI